MILEFEHSDGLNGLNINYKLNNNQGIGGSIYYPKTKVKYGTTNIDKYHFGGIGINLFKNIKVQKLFFFIKIRLHQF